MVHAPLLPPPEFLNGLYVKRPRPVRERPVVLLQRDHGRVRRVERGREHQGLVARGGGAGDWDGRRAAGLEKEGDSRIANAMLLRTSFSWHVVMYLVSLVTKKKEASQ